MVNPLFFWQQHYADMPRQTLGSAFYVSVRVSTCSTRDRARLSPCNVLYSLGSSIDRDVIMSYRCSFCQRIYKDPICLTYARKTALTKSTMADSGLSVDILLELFHYFFVDEIFHSFNGIVGQLPLLLSNGNTPLHVRRMNAYFRKWILPNIEVNNVRSIRIQNLYQMAPIDLAQFRNVHLLILQNVSAANWPRRFPIALKNLTLHVRSKDREEVLLKALSLDSIERLEFHSTFLHFRRCKKTLEKPSTIRHLAFNSQRCCIDFEFLRNNMPDLRTLRSINTFHPHRFPIADDQDRFSALETIDLHCQHMDIEAMISMLISIAVNSLRRCQLVNINNSLSSGIADVLLSWSFSDFSLWSWLILIPDVNPDGTWRRFFVASFVEFLLWINKFKSRLIFSVDLKPQLQDFNETTTRIFVSDGFLPTVDLFFSSGVCKGRIGGI